MSNMGHAYLALRNYEKATECYETLRKLGKEDLAKTYLRRLADQKSEREKIEAQKAKLENDKTNSDITKIVEKILKTGQEIHYYQGGLSLLEACLTSDLNLVELFSAAGGYHLFLTPPEIHIKHPVRALWLSCFEFYY